MKNHFISAIIPVYNEEKNLDGFLQTLCSFKSIDEIICIDDGSQDRSLEILDRYSQKIHIIHFQVNKGKGSAIAAGLQTARGDIVIFLDADLLNLNQKHIKNLIEPLLKHRQRAVVGYCRSSEMHFKLSGFISGQRAYYRNDLLPYINDMETMRYGIEMLFNSLFFPLDVEFIPLDNLRSAYKFEKYNSQTAARQYIIEGKEVFKALPRTVLTERYFGIVINRIKNYLPPF